MGWMTQLALVTSLSGGASLLMLEATPFLQASYTAIEAVFGVLCGSA
jgi:hypothetical protein